MRRRYPVLAGAAIVTAGAGLAALVGVDRGDGPVPAAPAVPTPADLEATMVKATDPRVPRAEQIGLVEGDDADGPRLAEGNMVLVADVPAHRHRVVDVRVAGPDRVIAVTRTSVAGVENPSTGEVPFVLDAGAWKIEKAWACTVVENLGHRVRAC